MIFIACALIAIIITNIMIIIIVIINVVFFHSSSTMTPGAVGAQISWLETGSLDALTWEVREGRHEGGG